MFLNDRDGWVGISTVGSFVVVETNIVIITINSPDVFLLDLTYFCLLLALQYWRPVETL